jgi:hypothetical protein
MGTELKHLNFEEKTFIANGKTYRIDDSFCFERWQQFEQLEVHVGYGTTFQAFFDTDKKIYEALNKIQFVEASALLHNRMNGIKYKLENRTHPALLLCALFINYEGEEITKYDSNIAEQKVKDWSLEGYAVQDFFSLAVNLVGGFIPVYNSLLENSLAKAKEGQNVMTDTV